VNQFNDGLYDIIIAADENALDKPQTVKPDSSTSGNTHKHKLVLLDCHITPLVSQKTTVFGSALQKPADFGIVF